MDLADVAAVLFDMDGTLVSSDAAVERAWRAWAGEYGVEAGDALSVSHGRPAEETVRELRPDLDDDAATISAARQLSFQYEDLEDVAAVEGADGLVDLLDSYGLPWAVVTSADKRLALARLRAARIRAPRVLVTSEDIGRGKPDPEGYLIAAARLGVTALKCLVVEDSLPGAQAGKAAGATVATLKGVPGDLEVPNLAVLTELLARALTSRAGS